MESERLTSRQIQAINTKNKIYEVSIDLMEKEGFENIKISDICKKAGVSVGSFYNYFQSKNDILIEIFNRADDYFKKVVSKNIKGENSLDQIVDFFTHYGKYNEIVGIDAMKKLYSFNNKMFISKGRYMQALLQEIITKGQEKKEIIKDMTPEEACEYLFISARGVAYDWCLHEGEYNIEEFMHTYFKRFVKLIRA